MGILIVLGIFILIVACWLWLKFVLAIFKLLKNKPAVEERKQINPYIEAQKLVDLNNCHYDIYLEWMQKNSDGVPLDKIKTREEIEADRQINKINKIR